jgi:hypothetical protein
MAIIKTTNVVIKIKDHEELIDFGEFLKSILIGVVYAAKEPEPLINKTHVGRTEAKKLLNIKNDMTLIRYEEKGLLRKKKIGGKVNYEMRELEALVKIQKPKE